MTRTLAAVMLGAVFAAAIAAPVVAPHTPEEHFGDSPYAPPTLVRLRDASGHWRGPYFHPQRLVDRLNQRYREDVSVAVPVTFFANGRVVGDSGDPEAPLLLLGADRSGRDVFARLVYGARASLGIALGAVAGAMLLGLAIGGVAGARGGWLDALLMRAADVVAVLPAIYLVVTLRAALPLVLPTWALVVALIGLLAVAGAPWIARGVRPIVAAENAMAHAEAARALGASPWRVLTVHLLPASFGFVARQAALLVPAFVLAEATLSFIGLGLPDRVPSWGTSLQETTGPALGAFPWLLAPAVAIFAVTLLTNIVVEDRRQ